jgi:putative oxidoreductase
MISLDPSSDSTSRAETSEDKERHSHCYIAGRFLLATVFVTMACSKVFHFGDADRVDAVAGYSDPSILVGFAATLMFVGGILLAMGWKTRITAGALIAYLTAATLLVPVHQSLAVTRSVALSNLGLVAALLFLAAYGAGGASLLSKRRPNAGPF